MGYGRGWQTMKHHIDGRETKGARIKEQAATKRKGTSDHYQVLNVFSDVSLSAQVDGEMHNLSGKNYGLKQMWSPHLF
jgi:hypothetical protein